MKILLVVLLIALVVYGVTRLVERRGVARPPRSPKQPPRVVAPDDDVDFLRDLERRKRREERERHRADGTDPDTPPENV